jgi:hypothetical protein
MDSHPVAEGAAETEYVAANGASGSWVLQAENKTASAAEPTQTVRFAAACGVVLGFKRGVILKILRVFRDGWETR